MHSSLRSRHTRPSMPGGGIDWVYTHRLYHVMSLKDYEVLVTRLLPIHGVVLQNKYLYS